MGGVSGPALHPALAAAVEAARAAGEIALRYYRGGFEVTIKPDQTPVTQADREAEQAIRARARPRLSRLGLPRRGIRRGGQRGHALDHRSHRRHQELHPRHPVLGGADRPRGARRDHHGRRLQPGHGRSADRARGRGRLRQRRAHPRVRLRRGCADATLLHSDLKLLSGGRLLGRASCGSWTHRAGRAASATTTATTWSRQGKAELYVEVDLKPWDIAPMKILVEEAGGRLTDFTGRPTIYDGPCWRPTAASTTRRSRCSAARAPERHSAAAASVDLEAPSSRARVRDEACWTDEPAPVVDRRNRRSWPGALGGGPLVAVARHRAMARRAPARGGDGPPGHGRALRSRARAGPTRGPRPPPRRPRARARAGGDRSAGRALRPAARCSAAACDVREATIDGLRRADRPHRARRAEHRRSAAPAALDRGAARREHRSTRAHGRRAHHRGSGGRHGAHLARGGDHGGGERAVDGGRGAARRLAARRRGGRRAAVRRAHRARPRAAARAGPRRAEGRRRHGGADRRARGGAPRPRSRGAHRGPDRRARGGRRPSVSTGAGRSTASRSCGAAATRRWPRCPRWPLPWTARACAVRRPRSGGSR